MEKLNELRKEKEAINVDKGRVFDRLEYYNREVRLKGDHVQKLRGGLSYGRLNEIEEQIKRLEMQLSKHTFKLPEERKLVGEIDRLKRSRKLLLDFNREKEELSTLRDEQKIAREEREAWFKLSKDLKRQEDQIRIDIRHLTEKGRSVKKQVDQLRLEKRNLMDGYRREENAYRKWQSEKRSEQRRKTEMERAEAAHKEAMELEEIKATCEPLLRERQLCKALILYCEKLKGSSSSASTPVDVQPDPLPGTFLALPLNPHRKDVHQGFQQILVAFLTTGLHWAQHLPQHQFQVVFITGVLYYEA